MYFDGVRPYHITMIRFVALTSTLADLTLDVVRDLDTWARISGSDVPDENELVRQRRARISSTYLCGTINSSILKDWFSLATNWIKTECHVFESDAKTFGGSEICLSGLFRHLGVTIADESHAMFGERGLEGTGAWMIERGELAAGMRGYGWPAKSRSLWSVWQNGSGRIWQGE